MVLTFCLPVIKPKDMKMDNPKWKLLNKDESEAKKQNIMLVEL